MAKPTIASLTADLAAAQLKLKKFEEMETVEKFPEEEKTELLQEINKRSEEFENLKKRFENLSLEHEELVLKYEVSPELADKVEKSIAKLIDNPKALLFKKMSLALGEVKRIPKNGWNDFFKYKYSQEGDILDGIRPILSEVGLMIWTTIENDERKVFEFYRKGKLEGQRTITKVKVKFIIGCADTGETLESVYLGEGEDESDKGLYKSYTGATKYFLTKNFLISSGDILQDDAPTDPEADTQRKYDDRQPQHNNRQNSYNSQQRQQNKNQGQSQQNTQNANKGQNQEPEVDKQKEEAKELWIELAGNEEGFEGFFLKQTKKGAEKGQIIDFLNARLAAKKEEEQAKVEEGKQFEGNVPEENAPETSEQPPNEAKEQTEGEHIQEDLNTNNKASNAVDEMTPEEYVDYVEDNLPFPLNDQEREQILNDARQGNRNHRK